MAPGRVEPPRDHTLLSFPDSDPPSALSSFLPSSPLKLLKKPLASSSAPEAQEVETTQAEVGAESRFDVLSQLVRSSPGGCAILDGGLATELERKGADINDPLWSAKCLLQEPLSDLVRQVHLEYYRAGADVSISASYQATIQGFVSRGFTAEHAEELLRRSVQLVQEARDQFWEEHQKQQAQGSTTSSSGSGESGSGGVAFVGSRQRPLVAASIGSYGAYLADGSEYSGDYGPDMSLEKLVEFHRRRVRVLASAAPDVLAFETIPSLLEAQALVRILEEENLGVPAWMSFNSKDGRNVVRGDAFEDCAAAAAACRHVVAVGINCTPPRFIKDLVLAVRKVTNKLMLVYPNSGESWDGVRKEWVESTGVTDNDFVSFAPQWVEAGASLMGGCCRTTPHTISSIRHALHSPPSLPRATTQPAPGEEQGNANSSATSTPPAASTNPCCC